MTPHDAVICWVLDTAAEQILLVHHRVFGWSCPGGHVEPGESSIEAAIRELWEETGIAAEPSGDLVAVTRNDHCPRDPSVHDILHHFRFDVALADVTGEPGQPAQWFPCAALPTPRVADLDVLLGRVAGSHPRLA